MSIELEMELYAAASPDFPEPDVLKLLESEDSGLAELYVDVYLMETVSVYLNPKQLRTLAEKASALADEMEAKQ